jgi:predicted phosphodiesterase
MSIYNSNKDNIWTKEELVELYRLRHDRKLTFSAIEKTLRDKKISTKTDKAFQRKYARMDWDSFNKSPDKFFDRFHEYTAPKKWTNAEMIQLDAYLQAGKSYEFIAEKLNRRFTSVESQAQHTDWKAWREIQIAPLQSERVTEANGDQKKQVLIGQLINSLIEVSRHEFDKLEGLDEKDFLQRVNFDKDNLPLSFKELKDRAENELISHGLGNPENIELGVGRYVVLGDSHGKHTKKAMFALLKEINNTLKPAKIIHIGHILDDDNDISYDWGNFRNLIVLSKIEELKTIQIQRNKFKFKFDVVREAINIGDLTITNQDCINDYVKTPISSLDNQIFDGKIIVNCHRLEFNTRCRNQFVSYFASPGCVCESHIVRTIKQIDFEDGKIIKQANYEGFSKYRKMRHTNQYWEQGLIVIDVDKSGNATIVPCSIKETKKGFTTSYFDKIITSTGVFKPEKKIFILGDMHCDKHDIKVLDTMEQVCKDYKPDVSVNVGDTFNYSSLNHHVMDRGGVILDKKILDEAAQTHFALKRVCSWAKESHLIYGNHERFANDFVEKYPQFGQYLDFTFICNLEGLGYRLTQLKDVLEIGPTKFIHGDIRMYGQAGSKLEKTARTFNADDTDTFIGHIHRPEIRFGCYSVGLSGQLDQDYNEPEASNWLHGFGLCNQFEGKSFSTTIAIIDNKCLINGKLYKPSKPDSWKVSNYKAKLVYS